ncbi:Metallo-dependent phosphatase-like protein [Lasiosphaeria ovina]|uniref:Metallo-dependent phosphatase-like protein n=1 Tax=Lasiosphaeria ovina TaxID=92902 RepID=A0AAE0N1V2_9PEZI|nr:Metallo-dependent phosphatase-like protein [Lasiosphaeria ovina]
MATDEAEGDSATATRQQPIVIGDLPARFIPSAPPAPGKDDGGKTGTGKKKKKKKEKKQKQKQPTTKRLIIVGDVHGQLATLRALLTKLDFDHPRFSPDDRHTANAEADTAETSSGSDHLVLVGDIVTKGPDSAGVVQLAMDLGASAVRGNHDENVLRAAGRISSLQATAEGQEEADEGGDEGGEAVDSVLAKKKAKAANEHARAVARTLSKAQLNWLAALPIALRISGGLPGAATPPWNARTIVVVHAGLVPSVALEKQDRWAVMNMRSLVYHPRRPHHHLSSVEAEAAAASEAVREEARHKKKKKPAAVVPVDGREGEPWSHAWNRAQNAIKTEQDRVVVVYGHDAKAGLQADLEVDISAAEAALPTDYNSDDEGSGMEDDDDDDDAAAAAAADSAGASASKKKSNKQNNKKKKAPHKHAKGIRYAFGLDSGCGHGRQLSALVIEAVAATAGPEGDGEGARITHHIVQVDCGGGEGK